MYFSCYAIGLWCRKGRYLHQVPLALSFKLLDFSGHALLVPTHRRANPRRRPACVRFRPPSRQRYRHTPQQYITQGDGAFIANRVHRLGYGVQ
jgi:hypothetical protein